tara:strand:+ start:550 stop:690 length:141 start_codon:yes stop_codon:yes gene_type:complete
LKGEEKRKDGKRREERGREEYKLHIISKMVSVIPSGAKSTASSTYT